MQSPANTLLSFHYNGTTGDKLFRSKDFSNALEISRVFFAPADLMKQMLGTKIGAATVFSALPETARDLQIVFDKHVLSEEWYGCSDGMTTGYMKIKTMQIVRQLLPLAKHTFMTIEV